MVSRPVLSKVIGDLVTTSCHCSHDVRGIRGRALLTVESDSGLKPAYYFTFVPDASPAASHSKATRYRDLADASGKQRPYSSDENALLVQLKEREGLPWSEIAKHFPARNAMSLQVHYSRRLCRKPVSWSGKQRSSRKTNAPLLQSTMQGAKTTRRPRQGRPCSGSGMCGMRDEQEWEVEQILASQILEGKLHYQVEWKGYEPDHTWYPAHGFKGAPYKIQNFHRAFPDQPGPPKRLVELLASWEAGRELEDIADDDLPE